MTGHLVGLWRKELQQQRWLLLGTSLLLACGGGVAAIMFQQNTAATQPMEIVAHTLVWFAPVIALTQAQASIVREYAVKTQLFVEALPLRRWEMPLAKFAWGLLTQLALAAALWLAVAFFSGARDARFLAVTGVRALAFVCCCWSLLFGLATLGRLRWLAYSTLLLLFWFLARQGVEVRRFGPIALIDWLNFPYERREFPVRALLESAAVGGLGLALGLLLPLLYEGSMAEVLARRASTAEKAGFWIVLVCQALTPTFLSREQHRAPFLFTGDEVLAGARWNTQVKYSAGALEPRARAVLDVLDRLAAGMATELGVAEPPALRVAHNPSFQGNQLRADNRELGAGVLIEANLDTRGVSLDLLSAVSARESFVQLSAGRALFEPNRWFTEGFSSYWAPRSELNPSDQHWLATLVARRALQLDAPTLTHWDRVVERIGQDGGNSLGFALCELLERRHGRAAMLNIARTLLARATVRNSLDVLLGRRADLPQLFEQSTGESWPSFVASFQTELDAAAARLSVQLGKVPALEATLAAESTEAGGDIVYQLSGASPDADRTCRLLHTQLLPYDLAVADGQLQAEAIPWRVGVQQLEGRLRGRYQSGQRLLARIDCWLPELANWVGLESRRLEVP